MLVSVDIGNGYSHTAGNIGQQGSSGVPSFLGGIQLSGLFL